MHVMVYISEFLLGCPTYMSADLCFTTVSSSSFFLFLFTLNLLKELNHMWPHGQK